jgi:hypothetical protein
MIYSCFNASTGLYDYFETPEKKALNADLPVPQLGAPDNKIGIPSIDAGRPLPAGARPVGHGWHARGMVANCKKRGVSGLGEVSLDAGTLMPLMFILGAVALAWSFKE